MTVVGEALVTLGTEGDLSGGLEGAVKNAASGLLGPVAGIGAAAVGIGAGLAAIGGSFDEAFDNIRLKTGATGDQLDGLEGSFKNVVKNVPTDFGSASEAISTLTQRVGLSGKPLEDSAAQFLNLARITGTDLKAAMNGSLGAFSVFGISAKDQGGKLDELFRVTQRTGISFGDLSSTLQSSGPTLKAAGLSFEQSAALVGTLAKNGVDAGPVMGALSKSLAAAAKEGKPAQQVLADTFAAIKGAPDDTAAAGAALDVFGAKAGPRLAGLIREGKLSYDELAKSLGSGDTISGAAEATDDWSQKLEKIKNQVLVGLEPLATAAFEGIGNAIDVIVPVVQDLIGGVRDFFSATGDGAPILQGVTDTLSFLGAHSDEVKGALAALGVVLLTTVVPPMIATAAASIAAAAPFIAIGLAVAAVGAAAVYAYEHFAIVRDTVDAVGKFFAEDFLPIVKDLGETVIGVVRDDVVPAFQRVAGFIADDVVPAFQSIYGYLHDNVFPIFSALAELAGAVFGRISEIVRFEIGVVRSVIEFVVGVVRTAWGLFGDDILRIAKSVFGAIGDVVGAVFGTIKNLIRDALAVVKEIIKTATALIKGDWSGVWDGIKGVVKEAARAVTDLVQGIIDTVGRILGGFLDVGKNIVRGLVRGIKAAAGDVADAILDTIPGGGVIRSAVGKALGLLGFADGGWVPGPAGAPQLAVVHGGEYVLSRDMLAGRATPTVSASGAGGGAVGSVSLPPGLIQVVIQGPIDADGARSVGQAVGAGFVDALTARRVAVAARAIA